MAEPTIADYESLIEKVAADKGLDKKTAAIHAAPLFYARYGVKPGDLKAKSYEWHLEAKL